MKRIGAISYVDTLSPSLKREFLFFDKLAINRFDNLDFVVDESREQFPWKVVIEEGLLLVVDLDPKVSETTLGNKPLQVFSQKYPAYNDITGKLSSIVNFAKDMSNRESWISHLARQMIAAQVNHNLRQTAIGIPAINFSDLSSVHSPSVLKAESYLSIVMNHFPTPTENVSWEQVIELCRENELTEKRRRLFSWQHKKFGQDFDALSFSDEIAENLYEYERYMRKHRFDIKGTRVECILRFSSEIIDDLLNKKISNAVEKTMSLFSRRLRLIVSDENAPGREVAYIADLNERVK